MVIKTEPCAFSEERIYPGHGISFVNRAGKKFTFATCKNRHLFLSGRKALNQRWTKQWRRAHKKESILRQVKKGKGRKTLKSERGIEGLSLQELLKKKNETAEQRKKAMEDSKKVPVTKQAKKADLNARLRDLRKKRKEQDDKDAPAAKGGAKKPGADAKKAGAKKIGAAAAKKTGAAPAGAAAKKSRGAKKKAGAAKAGAAKGGAKK